MNPEVEPMTERQGQLNRVNLMLVSLATCCVGAVSSNFRRICMTIEGPVWDIVFFLQQDDAEDRDEIESVMVVFEGAVVPETFTYRVVVTAEWPLITDRPYVAVFGRREDTDVRVELAAVKRPSR